MPKPTAAATKAEFSRNAKVVPKKEKTHPALKQATDSFKRYHGKPNK